MTRAAAFALMLTAIALGLANIALPENEPPNAGLPLVRTDFPLCVTIRAAPLLRSPRGRIDKRLDPNAFNDKGVS